MKLLGPVFCRAGIYQQRQPGKLFKMAGLVFTAMLFVAGSTVFSIAQDKVELSTEKPAVNAVTGSAWQAEVIPDAPAGDNAIPVDQQEVLQKINAYMQKFNDLEGQFIQTNPDNAIQKGKFYVLRPGRMRFDYNRPSRMRIVSDGKYLSIEDHDLKTVNKYPLEATPFRMLLTKNVDLQRDARILSLSSSDTSASIQLADKTGQSAGQIQLFFSMPEMELKEWVITDAQGLHTRIEISNLSFEKKLALKLFAPSDVGLANVFGEQ
jgi:outer membrane lipoprotein-sorting protein